MDRLEGGNSGLDYLPIVMSSTVWFNTVCSIKNIFEFVEIQSGRSQKHSDSPNNQKISLCLLHNVPPMTWSHNWASYRTYDHCIPEEYCDFR